MTGYYLFSQALSVAMFESSIVITISGVEPYAGENARENAGFFISFPDSVRIKRCCSIGTSS